MRRRPDVGVGNVRIPDSSGSYHRADALAVENAISKVNPSCGARSDRLVAERCRARGVLNRMARSILIINTQSFDHGKPYLLRAFA
jgi:hypothetical protein